MTNLTPLEKLAALGHEKANRILAEKVMGWTYEETEPYGGFKDTRYILRWTESWPCEELEYNVWSPCTNLNHAKMVVDKMTETAEWLNVIIQMMEIDNDGHAYYDTINAPADARMAAVFEALDLWPQEKGIE